MNWEAAWDLARWLLPAIGLAVGWWVRDRRKDRAAADVAEQTVPAEVKLKDIGAEQAQFLYTVQAFETERASLVRAISDRDQEIARKDAELAHRDARIASLLQQVAQLEQKLADVTRDLNAVRVELNELADHQSEGKF